jgi:UDP-perosamine 4-acetyltransferase
VILGGGGHARVVIDALQASNAACPVAVLDADRSLWGTDLLGVPIVGGDERLPALLSQGLETFVVGVGGVGDNSPRRALFMFGLKHGLRPLIVRHPAAVCSAAARIGEGSVLFAASVVNAGAVIGRNVIVNTGAIVEHDCVLGDHAHVATGARLASTVHVGEAAHIGAGATVRQRLRIGEGAVVGAGAVVVKDVEPWTVVIGVPARAMDRRPEQAGLSSAEPTAGWLA